VDSVGCAQQKVHSSPVRFVPHPPEPPSRRKGQELRNHLHDTRRPLDPDPVHTTLYGAQTAFRSFAFSPKLQPSPVDVLSLVVQDLLEGQSQLQTREAGFVSTTLLPHKDPLTFAATKPCCVAPSRD
jgi:hypothetical protein